MRTFLGEDRRRNPSSQSSFKKVGGGTVSRVLSLSSITLRQVVFIHLDKPLPTCSHRSEAVYPRGSDGSPSLRLTLLQAGVCLADTVTNAAGALLPHPFTYDRDCSPKRCYPTWTPLLKWPSTLCCTCLRIASTGNYPAAYPMEPGLSSSIIRYQRTPVYLQLTCTITQ